MRIFNEKTKNIINLTTRTSHTQRCLWILTPIFISCLWTYIAGKDLNWDQLNYHLYSPLSLLQDRFDQDFFPASFQSYTPPFALLPFYFMIDWGWHSLAIGLALAIISSANIYFLYFTARYLFEDHKSGIQLSILCTLLGLSTVVYWNQVGSSFFDVIVCIPLMAGIYLLIRHHERLSNNHIFWSGVLFGVATAAKLTSVIYAAPGVILLTPTIIQRKSLSPLLLYIIGGSIGLCSAGGYWFYKLWHEFSNPLFPYFNSIFKSEYFYNHDIVIDRFTHTSILDFFTFPFKMLSAYAWTYTEVLAPDIRLLIVEFLLLILIAKRITSTTKKKFWETKIREKPELKTLYVSLYFIFTYAFWLFTSSNGRYALPTLLLSGPVIGMLLFRLTSLKTTRSIVLLVLILQLATTYLAASSRWTKSDWTSQWFPLKIPKALLEQPFVYLSEEKQSAAFLAYFLHRDSIFVNSGGQHALDYQSPGGNRLKSIIDTNTNNLRTLTPIEYKHVEDQIFVLGDYNRKKISAQYHRLGLFVNGVCETVYLTPEPFNIGQLVQIFVTCPLSYSEYIRREFRNRALTVDHAFNRLEKLCPEHFYPSPVTTRYKAGEFTRYYIGTEETLVASLLGDQHVFVKKNHKFMTYRIGTLPELTEITNETKITRQCLKMHFQE